MPTALFLFLLLLTPPQEPAITQESLLGEMADLARLARLPDHDYRLVQYSSYDRRSTAEDAEGWFSNADGFGGEPIPGFEAVLREPGADGVGEFLLCDVEGPGAVVRGWSAGMGGTLRAYLDGSDEPFFEGSGYDFLARRSQIWFDRTGLDFFTGDAFVQQDADYFPVPFAAGLRVTWEGRLQELHFYHLEVRRYAAGVEVRSFDEARLAGMAPLLTDVAARLLRPRSAAGGQGTTIGARIAAGATLRRPLVESPRPGAVTELALRFHGDDLAAVLRGVVLRLNFDGGEPEVVAPVGDFFGVFPGQHPHQSLAITVTPDGWLYCLFVMPFAAGAELELENRCGQELRVEERHHVAPWTWDERSLHFRADWRQGPPIELVENRPVDLQFLRAEGVGRLVGVASLIVNPSRIPTPAGNWWGEGDEKVFVDDPSFPVLFGTGSEDYYNYSWSRPDLFDHPYCAQPVDSGPGTSGYVVNQRFHVLDDLLFRHFVDFRMELWPHRQDFPIHYARMAWWYARPGAVADTPAISAADLVVPPLPRWEPHAAGAAANSWTAHLEDQAAETPAARRAPEPLASRGRVLEWTAAPGDVLRVPFELAAAARYRLNLVARHRPDGGVVRVLLDGRPLKLGDGGGSGSAIRGEEAVSLRTRHATRMLSLGWEEAELDAGEHELTVECLEAGAIGFDYLWLQNRGGIPVPLPGAVEAEDLDGVSGDAAEGWQVQGLGAGWSGGAHLWVRATEPGQFVELEFPVKEPGRYRVKVKPTKSWDYGILAFQVNGEAVASGVDTWAPSVEEMEPVDLGVHQLGTSFKLRVLVTGSNDRSRPPKHYFGIDCIVLGSDID
ncbi:MAG: DUF2961 domain-containing protein [Planctomycetes bacterium]|nr:DUF2961 domain-containing protein [Planctomycetota bacterium]